MKTKIKPQYRLKKRSSIYIGDAVEVLPQLLGKEGKRVIISDERVASLFPEVMAGEEVILTREGERFKNLKSIHHIYLKLIALGADRTWQLIGIGGGIVCDITGFVASTYMRGIRFGFVPTTLLSQVDASVGGKNGVNADGYKNMIGTFNQPHFVLCDPQMLRKLPLRQFRAGMAEVIKAAILCDAEMFEQLEFLRPTQLRASHKTLSSIIQRAIGIKASIVERDETEQGERKLLNLGHTFAHAIEKCSSQIQHGEAVGIGICMAAQMALHQGLLAADDCDRICALVGRMELPQTHTIPPQQLLDAMAKDKKGKNGTISMILPTRIGHCEIVPMTLDEIQFFLRKIC